MRAIILGLMLMSSHSMACESETLEQLVELVVHNHPVLSASKDYYDAQSKRSNWKAHLQLAYANDPGLEDTANASINLEIPLFDRSHEISLVKSRVDLNQQREDILSRFMTAVSKVCADQIRLTQLDGQRQFYRDRLQYQQQRVDEGLEEAVSLWPHAKAVQQAEQSHVQQLAQISVELYALARQYGGTQWQQLQALLADRLN